MSGHNLREAIVRLLPYAEAEQDSRSFIAQWEPESYLAAYEDCRRAVSYAYEALNEAARTHEPALLREMPKPLSQQADPAGLTGWDFREAKELLTRTAPDRPGWPLPPDTANGKTSRAEGEEHGETLVGLLGDLMLWADCNGADFEDGLARAAAL